MSYSRCIPGLIMGILLPAIVLSQNFTLTATNPFDLVPDFGNNLPNKIEFVDWDDDGDLDILVYQMDLSEVGDTINIFDFNYVTTYFENTGSASDPVFSAGLPFFEDLTLPFGFFFPTAGDLNGDGRADLIAMGDIDYISNVQQLRLYYQEGRSNESFTSIGADSIGISECAPFSWLVPELTDLDLDGDLDLLLSGTSSSVLSGEENLRVCMMSRNDGTSQNPDYTEWFVNSFNSKPDTALETIQTGDIDNDGDIDLLGLAAVNGVTEFYFHENIATGDHAMQFLDPIIDPFGLPDPTDDRTFLSSDLADLDGDGDLDFFLIVLSNGEILIEYYENSLCTASSEDISVSICEGDELIIGETMFSTAGQYTIELESSNGCDSTVNLELTVLPNASASINTDICDGETFEAGGMTFDTEGTYEFSIPAANGCDSTVTLELSVSPSYMIDLDVSICTGDTYAVGDQTFTESGQYEIFLLTSENCDSTINLSLEVADAIVDDVDITACDGETVVLGELEITQPGTYEYMFSASSGCDSTVIAHVEFSTVSDSVTVDGSLLLSEANGAAYQWIDCSTGLPVDGSTSQQFEPQETGSYQVVVTDEFGCTATSSCVEVVISATSEPVWARSIIVYPNPAGSRFTIATEGPVLHSVQLLSTSGSQVAISTADLSDIPVNHIAPGMYILRLQVGDEYVTRKLVISR